MDQSQYNRRARQLVRVLEALRQAWTSHLGADSCERLILDTKPIPVVGYQRTKHRSDFAGAAEYS